VISRKSKSEMLKCQRVGFSATGPFGNPTRVVFPDWRGPRRTVIGDSRKELDNLVIQDGFRNMKAI
jgi:hypothetical protein